MKIKLPAYKNPPVCEVVCGIRFKNLEKFRLPHVGLLWDRFRKEYPLIQHAVPIGTPDEMMLIDESTGFPLPRVWFMNARDDQLIQFQYNRFYFNWRRRDETYPHYDIIIECFFRVWDTINSFIKEEGLGELIPLEYELSYINHIPKGNGWNSVNDLSSIFRDFTWNALDNRFLHVPEFASWQTRFKFDDYGFLNVNLKHGTKAGDEKPLLILELVAREVVDGKVEEEALEWFNMAR